jgi:hypothetical protein
MLKFTTEQIQSQFGKLPKDLQNAISSTEVHDSIVAIGNKYGLHVDQLGEMVDLVGLIMLGLSPSKDFVKNFSQEAGVKNDIASSIAEDINKEVFDKIRNSMKAIENTKESAEEQATAKSQQSLADLERVGGFTIEPTGQNGNGNGAVPANLPGAEVVTESKDDLVAGIENPPPLHPSSVAPEENHTDILVDHLLANPTGAAEEKIEKPVQPVAKSPIAQDTPKKAPAADSYREPIN